MSTAANVAATYVKTRPPPPDYTILKDPLALQTAKRYEARLDSLSIPGGNSFFSETAPPFSDARTSFLLDHYLVKIKQYEAELRILCHLGQHSNVIELLKVDSTGLHFKQYPWDLMTYLTMHVQDGVPLGLRLRWLREIVDGIAFLHENGVTWNDGHLRNILLDQDLHVCICDFNIAECRQTDPPVNTGVRPGESIWCSPNIHIPQDQFAFGTAAFTLLMCRFPHAHSLHVTIPIVTAAFLKHCAGDFDEGLNSTYVQFGTIVQNCWRGMYNNVSNLRDEVHQAADDLEGAGNG